MSGDPKTRYCAFCGYPYQDYETTCGSCGRALPYVAPTGEQPAAPPAASRPLASYPPPGGDAPPSRGGMPGWALGLIGCAVLTPILVVGIVIVAVVATNSATVTPQQKAANAEANLRAIWAAQQRYAGSTGDYVEFSITSWDQSDPEFKKLGLSLGKIHHSYDAFYDENDEFWITAIGDIDGDLFEDEWELSDTTGSPDHYANDITDVYVEAKEETEYEDEYYDEEEEEGGIAGGVVGGQIKTAIEITDDRAQTARANLEEIFAAQKAYKAKKKTWLAFAKGGDTQWKLLGADLPEEINHTYTATVAGGKLTLIAEGNLDDDAFVDRWTLDGATGIAKQWKNDALNLDLSGLQANK